MSTRSRAATRRRASAVGLMVLVVAFVGTDGRTMARAQGGRASATHPAQGTGTPGSTKAYGAPHMRGTYWPYPIKDPTADERAAIAGRAYRAILDEWGLKAGTSPRPGGDASDAEVRTLLELVERLGPWSLRRQEAEDNAAKSRPARYQSLADHLSRMSALEQGRARHQAGQAKATGGPIEPTPLPLSAEAARFFRPIDGWDIDQIVPNRFESERPLNLASVAVTPAGRAEIAGRVYRAILDEAVDRYLVSSRESLAHQTDGAILDALLAERLGFWSDLWSQAQDAADRDAVGRGPAAGVRAAAARAAGGRAAAIRAHIERMRDLEDGRFIDDVLKRAGRPAVGSVDMNRFREFAEVARFIRIEAEGRLPGGPSPKEAEGTDSDQAATAGRIYRAILDGAVHRYPEAPGGARDSGLGTRGSGLGTRDSGLGTRDGDKTDRSRTPNSEPRTPNPDIRLILDSRLAERLAAWSARWARAQIRADGSHLSQFNAVRAHVERMAALEDGRSLHETLKRAGAPIGGLAATAPPREFSNAVRFFHLEALWELEQIKSR
jgi:hypothetical protein